MKIIMARSYLGCIYHKAFGYDMIKPLQNIDLYLRYDWLGTECVGEFESLFLSGDNPIRGTYICWALSGKDPYSVVGPHLSMSGVISVESTPRGGEQVQC